MIGVSRRSPGRWENGEAEPRMAQLTRIAEVTGRPVGFFFDEPQVATRAVDMADGFRMVADLLQAYHEGRVDIRPKVAVGS